MSNIIVYSGAFLLGLANPAITLFAIATFGLEYPYTLLLASVVTAGFSALLTVVRPRRFWRWAVLISTGWCMFLWFVAVAYWFAGQWTWSPVYESLLIVGCAFAGAAMWNRWKCSQP